MRTKWFVLLIVVAAGIFVLSPNDTKAYQLSGTDNWGTGSASISYSIDTTTLTLWIDNTSPINLNNYPEDLGYTTGGNSPGITGFGFNLDPDVSWRSWSLTAYGTDGSLKTVGSDSTSGLWKMETFMAGVSLDYLPTSGNDINGALFNRDAEGDPKNTLPGGNNTVYFTRATLTMGFDQTFTLDENSLFVRMQNVGIDGEGSLKCSVPDASLMWLLGPSLIGLALVGRKSSKRA